jgi:hypothetical protein
MNFAKNYYLHLPITLIKRRVFACLTECANLLCCKNRVYSASRQRPIHIMVEEGEISLF